MLKIESIPVDQLIPYAGNARKHDDKNVSDIAGSIAEYGFNDPIAINEKDNVIIEGHGRLLAAKKLGMKEVPVIKLGHMTEAQLKAYTLVHNRMAEKSEWNLDILSLELSRLEELDVDIEVIGFADQDIKDLKIEMDVDDSEAELPDDLGSEPRYKQMTFTVDNEYVEVVEAGLKAAKENYKTEDGNSNGDALYEVCKRYIS